MRIWIRIFLIALTIGPTALQASATATAMITFTIASINSIALSGSPYTLSVTSATAGSQPTSASDNNTTYSVTTNTSTQKITGVIDTAMPSGVTLTINCAAPTGGTSLGTVPLDTTAANLVTGISNIAESSLQMTYTLSANVDAAPGGPYNRVLTYTLGP